MITTPPPHPLRGCVNQSINRGFAGFLRFSVVGCRYRRQETRQETRYRTPPETAEKAEIAPAPREGA